MPWLRAVKAYRNMLPLAHDPRPTKVSLACTRIVYLTPAQLEELARAYRHGASVYDLAERFGVNRRTVSKRSSSRLYEPDVTRAQQWSLQGRSTSEIAEVLKRPERLVQRALRSSGVPSTSR